MSTYTDLITSEHGDKPRFVATVDVSTRPMLDLQAALLDLDFDLDTAKGAQLDVIGLWVGISREIIAPISGAYFSWDTAGVGWDQAYWHRPFDPTQGITSLSDEPYRTLLRAVIGLNHWDGTLAGAKLATDLIFPDNSVYIQDNQDLSITVVVSGSALDVVSAALLTGGYLALKPATIRISFVFSSAPPAPVFGFDVDNAYLGGWDTGAWGVDAPPI